MLTIKSSAFKKSALFNIGLFVFLSSGWLCAQIPQQGSIPFQDISVDLEIPTLSNLSKPEAGRRIRQTTEGWEATSVYHICYLPTDWRPNLKYPVIVEYAGNGGYVNHVLGDMCSGKVEDVKLGFGLTKGLQFIWVAMPYVEMVDGKQQNALKWWGDPVETKRYCLATLKLLESELGADLSRVVLCGFSRGAIGCNVIGLYDDEIAGLWKGFFCHSHYDGVREKQWYPLGDRESINRRLARLGDRPTWISHEVSIDSTKAYLMTNAPKGRFTFEALPFPNHTDTWVLKDLPIRRRAREWLYDVIPLPEMINEKPKQ